MIVIDGTDAILGRLASYTAKKLLEGEEVVIINAGQVVVSGSREHVLEKYLEKRQRGDPYKGPFFPRMPDRIVRRTVRGMLPYKQAKGREAYKRLRVYIDDQIIDKEIAEKAKNVKPERLPEKYTLHALRDKKFVRVIDIARHLGAKV